MICMKSMVIFCVSSHSQAECLTSVSVQYIYWMNEYLLNNILSWFLSYIISVYLLDIIKALITKMSLARQFSFQWMINRTIFPCVCMWCYLYYFIKGCFPCIWKYRYLGGRISKIITILKTVTSLKKTDVNCKWTNSAC